MSEPINKQLIPSLYDAFPLLKKDGIYSVQYDSTNSIRFRTGTPKINRMVYSVEDDGRRTLSPYFPMNPWYGSKVSHDDVFFIASCFIPMKEDSIEFHNSAMRVVDLPEFWVEGTVMECLSIDETKRYDIFVCNRNDWIITAKDETSRKKHVA